MKKKLFEYIPLLIVLCFCSLIIYSVVFGDFLAINWIEIQTIQKGDNRLTIMEGEAFEAVNAEVARMASFWGYRLKTPKDSVCVTNYERTKEFQHYKDEVEFSVKDNRFKVRGDSSFYDKKDKKIRDFSSLDVTSEELWKKANYYFQYCYSF
jgi:hypothetical protein